MYTGTWKSCEYLKKKRKENKIKILLAPFFNKEKLNAIGM